MSVALRLSALALRGIVEGASSQVGLEKGGAAIAAFLTARFVDQSQNLHKALQSSVEQCWKALEIALAGDSLWNRCKALLVRAEDRAFAQQVRAFLDIAPLPVPADRPDFRDTCLDELRAART